MSGNGTKDLAKGAPDPGKASTPGERQQMLEAVAASQKIAKAREYAQSLRDKAAKARDPKEREKFFREAYAKEVEAHGEQSKLSRRMQSGTWQGMFGGGGIGLGTGLGLGAVVGTLVGTIVSVPTTALGTLIGAGVGAIHGPWITIGGIKKKWTEASPEEVVDYYQAEEGKAEAAQQQAGMAAEGGGDQPLPHAEPTGTAVKRKPRKLEVRSKAVATGSAPAIEEAPTTTEVQRRKPRKLDSRSQSRDAGLQRSRSSYGKENLGELPPTKEAEDSGYAEDG
ncbi:hypothetical protein M409DRAFT_52301 [Zasmidium cellare ATCC 36951]|uniref:Glycine zipper domain-containing protein n=1 Tax=Zasmidium cellare ATCC 36951 TaxID=1080233 RepID=A0A6A6CRM0_ZASCE|nr:uncharacterized protein M409DRAFT_52301 [Zasmidium cellare ATCC 36951]KAF2169804.1 hypothetical protein M409DRAFT_52301 [Zasmidium cellare ATCC 36951]